MAISIEEVPCESNGSAFALPLVASFLRDYWRRLVAISALVIVPCLWQPRIEAGDLPSHVYNAWLGHLITTGRAPGLWLAQRWNNVLFDLALSGMGKIVGWGVAEKIAVSGAVLIFFWGAFALVCALTRRLPWFLVPCVAVVAYGWTFEMGFMNNYISFGLAFLGLAIVVRGRGWERGLAVVLAPLIWLAHPLGLVVLVSVSAYILVAERLPLRHHMYLFVASVLMLMGIYFFIRLHHFAGSASWRLEPPFVHDGTDQFLLYGPQYMLPARLFRAFAWVCLLVDVVRRHHTSRWWYPFVLSAELYALTSLGAGLLPSGIDVHLFRRMGFLSIGFLTERLTSVSGILICCLLGAIKPHKWHLIGFGIIAFLFFGFLYNDTAAINRMEARLESKIIETPPESRVVAAILTFPAGRVSTNHIVDRACIGRCFSYRNYEPASGQFRVRATPGNAFVMTDPQNAWAATTGKYVVQASDLPLFEVYQCDSSMTALCVHELALGEKTTSTMTISPTYESDSNWVRRFNATSLLADLSLGSFLFIGVLAGCRLVARASENE